MNKEREEMIRRNSAFVAQEYKCRFCIHRYTCILLEERDPVATEDDFECPFKFDGDC